MRRLGASAVIAIALTGLAPAAAGHAAAPSLQLSTGEATYGELVKVVGSGCPDTQTSEPDGFLWMGTDPAVPDLQVPINAAPDGRFGATFVAPAKGQGDTHQVHATCSSGDAWEWLVITDNRHGRLSRVAGADRYQTAALLSQYAFAPNVTTVFIASGEDYPDALAAAPAATLRRSPVLLTRRDTLPAVTATEIRRLRPQQVIILGGQGAVSAGVATFLSTLTDAPVQRWFGRDRYATAATITTNAFAHYFDMNAVVTSGQNFPDALSAGGIGAPLILTASQTLPAISAEALHQRNIVSASIIGGTAAVSQHVQAEIKLIMPASRIAGPDRYATSAAVSAATLRSGSLIVFVASGTTFPDALAGAPVAGMAHAPVLLTSRDYLPEPILKEIQRLHPYKVVILGGPAAVDSHVEQTLAQLVGAAP